jgi:hypothetical protein
MSTSREGPNPLRPYYRPPSIGIPQDTSGTTSSGTHGLGPKNGSAASYASSARDMFDYSDYLSDAPPSSVEAVKKTLDDWFYKYFSILLSQPFDVAKTVLQVRHQGLADGTIPAAAAGEAQTRSSSYRNSMYSDVGITRFTGKHGLIVYSTLQTTQIRTSLRISPLLPSLHIHTRLPDLEGGGVVYEMILLSRKGSKSPRISYP